MIGSIFKGPWPWIVGGLGLAWFLAQETGVLDDPPPDAGGDAMEDDTTGEVDMSAAWWQSQAELGCFPVEHRERANGVDSRLLSFLDWWELNGPFRICVCPDGGIRRDEAAQQSYFDRGTSGASSLAQTPHGRGGALDLAPYVRNAAGLYAPAYDDDEGRSPGKWRGAYATIGAAAKVFGLAWGGDFSHYDGPHVEVPNWRSLSMPAVS